MLLILEKYRKFCILKCIFKVHLKVHLKIYGKEEVQKTISPCFSKELGKIGPKLWNIWNGGSNSENFIMVGCVTFPLKSCVKDSFPCLKRGFWP